MSSIVELLNGLKGTALDLKHIELLKHAYELQEQNIDQLKTNNEALRESTDLLKQNNQRLQEQVEQLETELESEKERALSLENQIPVSDESLDPMQESVLQFISENGGSRILVDDIYRGLSLSASVVGFHLGELVERGMVSKTMQFSTKQTRCSIRQVGRRYLADRGLLK